MATASTPIRIEVGLSQEVMRSPAALPTGTLPAAIPPIAAPSANGASSDEQPNTRSITACSRWVVVPVRNA